jgi:hypothetical protein
MITFEQMNKEAIGMNAVYRVRHDGNHVATIARSGHATWVVHSIHYWEPLASAKGIDRVKAKATALEYPSEHEVYEKLCAATAIKRRNYIEKESAAGLATLARELINGSNSARCVLEETVAEMDRFIFDRSDTHANAQARAAEHNSALGKWHPEIEGWKYAESDHHYPYYPDAPSGKIRGGE